MNWNDKPRYNRFNTNDGHSSSITNHSSSITNHSYRGDLSRLMTETQKCSANIQDLSYDFASRIIRLYQYVSEDSAYKEHTMSKQILRSGTSVGANVREAQHAQSDADFLSKMSIARKEADETSYWLNLLHDNGYLNNTMYESINQDNDRISRILTSIVKTTKQKIENTKKH